MECQGISRDTEKENLKYVLTEIHHSISHWCLPPVIGMNEAVNYHASIYHKVQTWNVVI